MCFARAKISSGLSAILGNGDFQGANGGLKVTSLGAHSDFVGRRCRDSFPAWSPHWILRRLMARPLQPAYQRLAPIKPDIAAAAGLGRDVGVFCGVHDSNASLLPHLGSRQAPFTIVSTGNLGDPDGARLEREGARSG